MHLTELDSLNIVDQNNQPYRFNDFSHQPYLLLYFYPKDMTPGCTTQAQGIQEHWLEFVNLGCRVCGVSKDSPERHTKFIEKNNLSFTLLSDQTGELCDKFDVWVEKSMYGKTYMGIERSSFILDKSGIIQNWRKVKPKDHAERVLDFLKARQK